MNKKKLVYIILLMISIIITGTLAYFSIVTDRTALVLVLGERDEVLVTLEPFEIKGTLLSTVDYTSFQSNEIEDDYIQITAENFSSVPKKVSFYYRINSIDDVLVSTNLKYAITSSNTIDGTYSEVLIGNFSTAVEGHDLTVFEFDIPAETTIFFRVFTYLDGNEDVSSMSNSVINAEFRAEMDYTVTPELDAGMIPAIFTPEGVYTVSTDSEYWYDYEKHMWANAVLVTEESRSTYQGTNEVLVEEDDILAQLVWIPRYEYRIDNLGTNYAGGTQASPGAISINFIPSYITLPTSSSYKIHPAFTFGDEEVSGFWVGKFPTSGSSTNPVIKMSISSYENFFSSVYNMFDTSLKFSGGNFLVNGEIIFGGSDYYGTTSSFDSHMIKSSEWGAVAYLGQSMYGSCENPQTCRLNNMAGTSTGYFDLEADYSNKSEEETFYMALAMYSGVMDLLTVLGGELPDSVSNEGERHMSVYQYDGNYIYTGSNSDFYSNSGFIGYIGDTLYDTSNFIAMPDEKYYDRYTSTNLETACNGRVCYGHALSETAGWYNTVGSGFVNQSAPWLMRNFGPSHANMYFSTGSENGGEINLDTGSMKFFRTVILKSNANSNNDNSDTEVTTSGATMLINKANAPDVTTYIDGDVGEMYTFSQPSTTQLEATTDYRYIGSTPNNYIIFNNETWRIIGVFDGKVKIVKDSSIGRLSFDYKNNGLGSSRTEYGSTDWTDSQLMYTLNPTDIATNVALKTGYTHDDTYIYDANNKIIYQKGCLPASANGTTYNCTSNSWGVNSNSLEQIADVTYYLGRVSVHYGTNDTAQFYYNGERNGNIWTGKVGLMYSSDYAYTFAYGVNDKCYNSGQICDSGVTSWIYALDSNNQYFMTAAGDYTVYTIYSGNGRLDIDPGNYASRGAQVHPVVYLKSNIKLSGNGTRSNPYKIVS